MDVAAMGQSGMPAVVPVSPGFFAGSSATVTLMGAGPDVGPKAWMPAKTTPASAAKALMPIFRFESLEDFAVPPPFLSKD